MPASTPLTLRIAAVVLWINAVGFGIPCLMAIRNLLAGQDIPFIMGFPAYGRGPFEQHGIQTTVWLVLAFLLICLLEAVAGWWLWRGHRAGAILSLALIPFGVVFWWGFALPFPPLFAIARTILIAIGWRSLT
jgi:hypothetical protein